MKNNLIVFFVFFGQFQYVVAQSTIEKVINGQITSNAVSPIEGVNIVNTSSKIMVVSDQYGHFSIVGKEGDVLIFSTVNYEFLRKIINRQQFTLGSITVDLTPMSIELDEVVINKYSNITTENFGIIPKDQIKLTTAERNLQIASDFNPQLLLGTFAGAFTLGGKLTVDPIFNGISGRTKRLKKELSVEKKEFLIAKLEDLFDDKYFIETLKIPELFIKGFQYYCVEDLDFAKSLNNKNKTMSMFLIVELASKFNKNQ